MCPCCRFCKFSTAGKTAPGVKMKLESQKGGGEDVCGGGGGRREVCGYGRNIFMGYLNRDNDTKVSRAAAGTRHEYSNHRRHGTPGTITRDTSTTITRDTRTTITYLPQFLVTDTSPVLLHDEG